MNTVDRQVGLAKKVKPAERKPPICSKSLPCTGTQNSKLRVPHHMLAGLAGRESLTASCGFYRTHRLLKGGGCSSVTLHVSPPPPTEPPLSWLPLKHLLVEHLGGPQVPYPLWRGVNEALATLCRRWAVN